MAGLTPESVEISYLEVPDIEALEGLPGDFDVVAISSFTAKPVPKVIDEIHRIKEQWKHPFIEFADDNTFAGKRHGHELVTALIPEGLRWFTETDISVARDPELVRLMKEDGCAQVLVGLESPNTLGLDRFEKKAIWKTPPGRQVSRCHRHDPRRGDYGQWVLCVRLGSHGHDVVRIRL